MSDDEEDDELEEVELHSVKPCDEPIDELTAVEVALDDKSASVSSSSTCSESLLDEIDAFRVFRIKYRYFRDSKLKLCSDSPYDVTICSESHDIWSTFVLS